MPFVLFLIGAATLALVATNSHPKTSPPAPPSPNPYALDPQLDPRLRAQVEAALLSETDPTRLEAFAASLASYYPIATWYLRQKAEGMRKMGYGGAPTPQLPPARADGLDASLPDTLRFNVVELLTQGTDPAMLETFAGQLGSYPLAAAALRLQASVLRAMAQRAQQPGTHAPGPAAPTPTLPGFDPNLPPELATQVATALMTENDPVKLRALGDALMARYPTTAMLLLSKANALTPVAAPAPAAPPVPSPIALPDGWTLPQASAQPTPAPAPRAPIGLPDGWSMPKQPAPATSAQSPAQAPAPQAAPVTPNLFDAGMTPEEQSYIVNALSSESDPAKLRQLADAIGARYPRAATLLLDKANAIQVMMMPGSMPAPSAAPQAPAPPPAPPVQATAPAPAWPSATTVLPTTMSLRKYHVKQGDFPIKIAKQYGQPEAAWRQLVDANAHKPTQADGNFKQLLPGEDLNIPASWPIRPGEVAAQGAPPLAAALPVALSPTNFVAASNVPAGPLGLPHPGAPVLDSGIPAQVAQSVLTAAATETDPVRLRDFSSAIMAQYPIAAAVLLAKANGLTLGIPGLPGVLPGAAHPASPAPPAAPAPAPVLVSSPAPAPGPGPASVNVLAGGKYKVERGDSPSRIAKKITGNDRRWPELVKANPTKPTTADGNFKSLQPGEVLQLPPSWTSSPQPNGALASA